ncbi:Os03g0684800 [Oryza sativa Japonica Group]|uniref:Os03g0684800 protein n=1 Tax=Oryza sativa subsp. japonica TaxID=39947 RepID=C7IZY8_ORYSJ|nr:Os03g0684800 [Oryza sativa Japonica Group]|eukprot:NP_001173588.1 Os03g0684800 [Oryza sativa Japonica Group]
MGLYIPCTARVSAPSILNFAYVNHKHQRSPQEGPPFVDAAGRLGEIWNERNRRTFQQKELLSNSLLTKIKEEARAWILAGAKHLGNWLIT